MKYKILSSKTYLFEDAIENLQIEVNNALEEGWKLQGGVATFRTKHDMCIVSQAMIKED